MAPEPIPHPQSPIEMEEQKGSRPASGVAETLPEDGRDSAATDAELNKKEEEATPTNYIKGTRLHLITVSLCLTMWLTSLEVPIVSTSLVGITDELGDFERSSWIVTAYLLTFIGFLIIWAKLSDHFGRKLCVSISIFLFAAFSGACGGAQTMVQLIVFRALQGLGGSGIFSLCTVIFFELVPAEKYPAYTSLVGATYAISLLLGPILGGAINDGGAWRWIFLLNVPAAMVALLVLFLCLPNGFPYHGSATPKSKTRSSVARIDVVGALILLGATILLVTAIQEAGTRYAWNSAFVIAMLTVSGVLWLAFLGWSKVVSTMKSGIESVFPWSFVHSRIWMGLLLTGFFLGGPFSVAIFQIPQRYQVVNGATPLMAGVRLLPFTFACPIASILSAMIAGKTKVPVLYMVIVAACLQIVGFGLLTTLPTTREISKAQYGYQVLAGLGTGVNISTLQMMVPYSVPKKDQAVGMGAFNQIRYMGGAIGIGIISSVLNGYVNKELSGFLKPEEVGTILQTSSIANTFPPDVQDHIRQIFGQGYNLQMKILVGMASGQVPASFLMWQKNQIKV